MDATTPLNPEAQRKQDRARKRKAILAGGVVLGLGAAVTLAAWSDDVFANGTFNTGGFELQGSVNGTVFQDYDDDDPDGEGPGTADGPVSLSFNLEATEMAPSQTVYAPFAIATSSATDLDGTFSIDSVQATGKYSGILTYRVFQEGSFNENCSAANASALDDGWTAGTDLTGLPILGPLLGAITGFESVSRPVIDPIPVTSPLTLGVAAKQGDQQNLCIAVTLGAVPPATGALAPVVGPLVRSANQTAVTVADLGSGTDDTTVTWTFNGQSTDAS